MKKIVPQPKDYEIAAIIWGNIRRIRYLNKLTDEQIAVMLGVTVRTLSSYEKDPSKISLEKLQRFIDNTKIDFSEFTSL